MSEFQKASDVTQDMINSWAEKFKSRIRIIEIPITKDEIPTGDKAKFFIRKPDRTLIDVISKHSAENDYGRANSVLMKNCVLGGDMIYLASEDDGGQDDIYRGVLDAIGMLVEKKKATFLN
jgi:hypothetical protein